MESFLEGMLDYRSDGSKSDNQSHFASRMRTQETAWPEVKPMAWQILARLDQHVSVSTLIGGNRDAVLLYHSVGGIAGAEYDWNLTEQQFQKQMRLVSNQFEPVPLSELTEPDPDRKRVAVTFDDGFRNFAETAAPILKAFQVPATVFVCPAFIGDENIEQIRDRHNLGQDAKNIVMTESQIEEIAHDDLFTLGNHTTNHLNLSEVNDQATIVEEIVGGKQSLESRFGVTVDQFSYPYGKVDARAATVIEKSHEIIVTSEPSLLDTPLDLYEIPRIDACQPFPTLRFEMTDLGDYFRRLHRRLPA